MSAVRTYAIGDIHGQLEMLREAHGWIAQDVAKYGGPYEIVHVGDLVDRGPDSAGVIGHLMHGQQTGQPWIVLKGNHDRMMAMFLGSEPQRDPNLRPEYTWTHERLGGLTTLMSYDIGHDPGAPAGARWLHPKGGGMETLHSYDVDGNADDIESLHRAARAAVPREHIEYLNQLPLLHQTDAALFVHAGIKPGVPIDQQAEDDLLWIRAPFHNYRKPHEALVVHGHTPIDTATHYGNRINIDTGAGYGKALAVIVVEGAEIVQLNRKGRRPLQQLG